MPRAGTPRCSATARCRKCSAGPRKPGAATPSRLAFQQDLERSLAEPGAAVALAIIDLDDLDAVNSAYGHDAGDAVLRAAYWAICERSPGGTMVVRLGEDEFGLLPTQTSGTSAADALREVLACCKTPLRVDGQDLAIKASAGLVHAGDMQVADGSEVLKLAGLALAGAKSAASGELSVFDRKMRSDLTIREGIRNDLVRALRDDEPEL